MKKFLLCGVLALLMLSLSVAVCAEEVGGWMVPNGFPLDGSDGEVSKPVVTVDANGVASVQTGGWYTDGASWGGIASVDKYALDGLKVEVQFSKVCEIGDRWINIGFFEKPEIFRVGDIPANKGYGNLIRPKDKEDNSAISWQHVEALTTFAPGSQPIAEEFKNDMKLTMEVKKTENGGWKFILNGQESDEYTGFAEAFKGDRAHIVIATSGQHAIEKDSYTYTVKVTGEKVGDLSAEELATWQKAADEKAAAAKAEADKKAEELKAKKAQEEADKKAKEEEEAAKKALEETDKEEVKSEDAKDTAPDTTAAPEDAKSNNTLIIIIIIVAVVAIAGIVVVVTKKKK